MAVVYQTISQLTALTISNPETDLKEVEVGGVSKKGLLGEFLNSSGNVILKMLNSGYVGIGTAAPGSPLVIQGAETTMPILRVTGTGTAGAYQHFDESGVKGWYFGIDDGDDDFKFREDSLTGDVSLILKSGGYVGIGTEVPDSPLVIQGAENAAPILRVTGTGTAGAYQHFDESGVKGWYFGIDDGDDDFKFREDTITGSVSLTLQAGGNVGIGTITPGEKVDIVGKLRISPNSIGFSGITNSANNGIVYAADSANANKVWLSAAGLSYLVAGNVGIGTTAPGQILDVNQGSGNMIADGYDNHSLAKYKDNIENLTDNLSILSQLKVRKWNRKPRVTADELRELVINEFGKERWDEIYPENNYRGGALRECEDLEVLEYINNMARELRSERRGLLEWQRTHYGLVADEIPDDNTIASKNKKGEVIGYSINNYIGLLHGCINELTERIEILEGT